MAEKLDSDLRRRLEELSRNDPDARLQFVVSLRPGASAASVAAAGMTIDQQIADPPLVLGTMTSRQALKVARLDAVALVEHDAGGMHALGSSD
jgi:hypothetical protein